MALENLSIDQSSAPQQVAKALRELLLTGEVPPGAKLREVPLAKTIGVSRHTLRAAFRILEAEGLLEHSLHRGVIVPELSEDRIADVFRARKSLEFAGIHSIDVSSDRSEVVVRLRAAVERMQRSHDDAELASADLEFHSAVVGSAGSKIIDDLYRNIQAQLRLTRAWALRTRGDRDLMVETHSAVVENLEARRQDEAARALMEINDVGEKRLLKAMNALEQLDEGLGETWPSDHNPQRAGTRTTGATTEGGDGLI